MKYFFVLALLGWAYLGECQIVGSISDESGNALKGWIYIEGTNKSTEANVEGVYEFKLKPGAYSLVSFVSGYKSNLKVVEYDGTYLVVDFVMGSLGEQLDEVVVNSTRSEELGLNWLQSVEGTSIYEAKKTELIQIDNLVGNLATNSSRQVYARVPGLNIFENDGAGLQLAIGARGLDPNRTSNFNVRQNGYDISADALGYPESYYTPPVQALQQIEIVRGAAGLQYGSQFGGLLNFKFREGPKDRKLSLDLSQTVGSYGLFNSFNSVGGTVGKTSYYGFYQYKRSDGWRPNAGLNQHTAYGSIKHEFNPFLSVKIDYTSMNYTAQQPGGLTDQQFEEDPLQSNRTRNWFEVGWNLGAMEWDFRINSRLKFNNRTFFLNANRFALGNLERIDRPDDLTQNRNLIKDNYDNWGNELRAIYHYDLGDNKSVLLIGNRYYEGRTLSAQGLGTSASDADFDFVNPEMPDDSEYEFPSRNVSVFVENIFNLSSKFSLTPGFRYEYILTEADGYYVNNVNDFAGNIILSEIIDEQRRDARDIYLFGLGVSYKLSERNEFYANFSQNYRGINFTDIRVDIPSLVVDPDISDESGFNIDLGLRGGKPGIWSYDISGFFLAYSDRIGNVLTEIESQPRTLRTNIGDANIIGLESYGEWNVLRSSDQNENAGRLKLFMNLAFIYSEYTNASPEAATLGEVIEGNEVELVPPVNIKVGATYQKGSFRSSVLYSHIGAHFSDAANTTPATFSAVQGPIPTYEVIDFSVAYDWKSLTFDTGINNLLDRSYFTRRATGYPGPGIIPAEPRSYYFTVRFRY